MKQTSVVGILNRLRDGSEVKRGPVRREGAPTQELREKAAMLKLAPVPSGGETVDQAKKLGSTFQTLLAKFKRDPRSVVWFHVFKDSIGTYLAARDITDQAGVPAGWELYGSPFFVRYLPPEWAVEYTPAPPPPPAAPGTVPVVTIAPPKATLD